MTGGLTKNEVIDLAISAYFCYNTTFLKAVQHSILYRATPLLTDLF